MARKTTRPALRAVIEYENLDVSPAYVEGAQGVKTPQGALHVSFYSEFFKHKNVLKPRIARSGNDGGTTTYTVTDAPDAFGLDAGDITIVRRIESSMIMTVPTLRAIVPWLQMKLNELENEE